MKMSAILIAAVALGASAPVLAAAQTEDGQPVKVIYDAKHDKYCVVTQEVTGSILPQKDCRSKQDWAKVGLTLSRPADGDRLASK